MSLRKLSEAILTKADLDLRLQPISEADILNFMSNLKGGTYFNMGMFSEIPVARAYKKSIKIYKVMNQFAIVSGISFGNKGDVKDFRAATGKAPSSAWYDHMRGYENKVGVKKSDPNAKYVLWDVKLNTNTWVAYYVVDADTNKVTPVSKAGLLASDLLTPSEKAKLTPKPVIGIDLNTGAVITKDIIWRTAAFNHIFWLEQGGKTVKSFGKKFSESYKTRNSRRVLEAASRRELFIDLNAGVDTDVDQLIFGEGLFEEERVEKRPQLRRRVRPQRKEEFHEDEENLELFLDWEE